jgi:DNA-directed RNA polymerase subunit M/transcription elongation factor TFIIS
MFAVRGANVYRVTCPKCGEEYTTFDSDLERSPDETR